MIVKLDKNSATPEGTKGFFHFGENRFIFWPDRREKVKFLGTEHNKTLNFLDMLRLSIWTDGDALTWYKKQ